MRVEPMIAVSDVETSSTFYEKLLGATNDHGGNEFGRLIVNEEVVLLIHHWGDPYEPHRTMEKKLEECVGHGLVLYFRVKNLETIEKRIKDHRFKIVKPKRFNSVSRQHEIVINDPDGYEIIICAYE